MCLRPQLEALTRVDYLGISRAQTRGQMEPFAADSSPIIMAQVNRGNRKRDLDRIRRLFTPDDAEFQRLVLIARLEMETRLYAAD